MIDRVQQIKPRPATDTELCRQASCFTLSGICSRRCATVYCIDVTCMESVLLAILLASRHRAKQTGVCGSVCSCCSHDSSNWHIPCTLHELGFVTPATSYQCLQHEQPSVLNPLQNTHARICTTYTDVEQRQLKRHTQDWRRNCFCTRVRCLQTMSVLLTAEKGCSFAAVAAQEAGLTHNRPSCTTAKLRN